MTQLVNKGSQGSLDPLTSCRVDRYLSFRVKNSGKTAEISINSYQSHLLALPFIFFPVKGT